MTLHCNAIHGEERGGGLADHHLIVLSGPPGAGKSTFTRIAAGVMSGVAVFSKFVCRSCGGGTHKVGVEVLKRK